MHADTGDIPEETYHAQQKLQVDVLDLFRMVDQAANRTLTGALPKREIQVLLKGAMLDVLPNCATVSMRNRTLNCVYTAHTAEQVTASYFASQQRLHRGIVLEIYKH